MDIPKPGVQDINTWDRIIANQDVLWNVFLQSDLKEVNRIAKNIPLSRVILEDSEWWRQKLEHDNPTIYNLLIRYLLPEQLKDVDWKLMYSYAEKGVYYTGIQNTYVTGSTLTGELFVRAIFNAGTLKLVDYEMIFDDIKDDYPVPASIVRRVIRKILDATNNLQDRKDLSRLRYSFNKDLNVQLVKATLFFDDGTAEDLANLEDLLNNSKKKDGSSKLEHDLDVIEMTRSMTALDFLIAHFGFGRMGYTINTSYYFLPVAARICPSLECFLQIVRNSGYNESEVVKLFEKKGVPQFFILKYLIEKLGVTPTKFILSETIKAGQLDGVEYLMSMISPSEHHGLLDAFSFLLLGTTVDSPDPSWIRQSRPDEYLAFQMERFRILEFLLQYPVFDEITLSVTLSSTKIFQVFDAKLTNELSLLKRKIIELIIHRLDYQILREDVEKLARDKFNLPSLKLILVDHRVSLIDLKTTKNLTILKLLPLAEKAQSKKLWTLRRISTLINLSNFQQYQLMEDLKEQNRLDPDLSRLLEDQNFIDAYLADNATLAEMLNTRDIRLKQHVNHPAAAALYARDIKTFNSLVPFSSKI
ncbi:Hypothetical protein POVR1_LOCUS432 [uncultured virus]|nr:Hypothetical protein POVR1_LOCUS432 [uncultured virus]